MDLNLLAFKMKKDKVSFINKKADILNIRFLDERVIDHNTLYIVPDTKYLIDSHKAGNYLVYTDEDPISFANHSEDNIIVLQEKSDLFNDMNELLSLMQDFQVYYHNLYRLISIKAEIEDFIKHIYDFFEEKLCILDHNKKLIYNSLKFSTIGKIYPLKIQKSNLSKVYGYLGFEQINDIYEEEILKTAKIIGNYLYDKSLALLNSKDDFYQSLKDLLMNQFTEKDFQNLKNITWDIEDPFDVYVIELNHGLYYYKNMFINGNRFSLDNPMYMYSILQGNKLICLINTKNKYAESLNLSLQEFVHEYELKSVEITLNQNLMKFSETVKLANTLLDHDIQLDGPLDQELYPLVYKLSLKFAGLESFLPRELLLIKKHDDKNNSDLLLTLYSYLMEERSLIKASERLDVHRNSIVYRMNKINELVDLDLDKTEIRSNILAGLEIMYHSGLLDEKTN